MKRPKPRYGWALIYKGRLLTTIFDTKSCAIDCADWDMHVVRIKIVPCGKIIINAKQYRPSEPQ